MTSPVASPAPVPVSNPEVPAAVESSVQRFLGTEKLEQDGATQHVADLIASLTSSTRTVSRAEVLQELSIIAQESPARQRLVASLGGIAPAVDLLSVGSSVDQVHATTLLAYLAQNNLENQTDIASRGALQALVHILTHSATDEAKDCSASALMYLIFNHSDNQAALCRLHALSELVLFVAQGNHETFIGVSEALRLLTDIAESHRDFVSIVAVLQYGPDGLQIRMAQEIAILAEDNAENKDAFSATGAVNVLVNHLSEGSEELVEHSAHAMKCLATRHAVNREAIVTAGGIAALIAVIPEGTAGTRVSAMDLLRTISSYSPTHRATIAASGVIEKLKAIKENNVTASQVKQSAEMLLKEITQRPSFTATFLSQFTHAK